MASGASAARKRLAAPQPSVQAAAVGRVVAACAAAHAAGDGAGLRGLLGELRGLLGDGRGAVVEAAAAGLAALADAGALDANTVVEMICNELVDSSSSVGGGGGGARGAGREGATAVLTAAMLRCVSVARGPLARGVHPLVAATAASPALCAVLDGMLCDAVVEGADDAEFGGWWARVAAPYVLAASLGASNGAPLKMQLIACLAPGPADVRRAVSRTLLACSGAARPRRAAVPTLLAPLSLALCSGPPAACIEVDELLSQLAAAAWEAAGAQLRLGCDARAWRTAASAPPGA